MKAKVLLVPFFLVISITLIIWLVYPAFSDLQLSKEELKDVQDQVDDVEIKLGKTMELMSSLASKSREQELVYQFLPDSQKEEEVIDVLNSIVYSEGMTISKLSVERPRVDLQNVVRKADEEGGANKTAASTKLTNFKTDLRVVGSYEKIRNVIKKINRIKRFNNIEKFTISKNSSQDVDPNSLYLDLVLNFNYLEKIKTIASVNNQIFTSGEFDMSSVVEDLERYRTGYGSQLTVTGTGRSNPFVR